MPLDASRLDELQLPLMVSSVENTGGQRTALTVWSTPSTTRARALRGRRCTTVRAIDPATSSADLARPGHIFPLRYCDGGV